MRFESFFFVIFSLIAANFLAFNVYLFVSATSFWGAGHEADGLVYAIGRYLFLWQEFFEYSIPVSAFVTVIVGLPLYWFANKFDAVNGLTCFSGGIAVVVLPFIMCKLTGWNFPDFLSSSGAALTFYLAICGGFGGAVFYWLINRAENKRNL